MVVFELLKLPALARPIPGLGRINLWYVALALAIAVFPLIFKQPFPQHLMIMIGIYTLLGSSWNILGGYTGQVSLGHSVYFGIGAYTSTLLYAKAGVSPWLGMLAGGALAVVVGLVVGFPTFRLQGRYFAIATLAIVQIIYTIILNWDYVGGAVGLFVPLVKGDRLSSFQFHTSKAPYLYIVWTMVILVLWFARWLRGTYLGYYFRAVREDEQAASSLGIDTRRCKLAALSISTFIAAVTGTFYAQYVMFIDPDSTLLLSVTIVLVAVMGGVGEFIGPLVGAVTLIPLSEMTRVYLSGRGRALDLILYGALIVLITTYEPRGIVGLARSISRRVSGRKKQ